jgi:hypothetical protein
MERAGDQRPTASPRSTTGSTASVSHASSMTSTALSPPMRGSAGRRQHAMAQEEGSSALIGTTMAMVNVAPQDYRSTSMLSMGQMMSGPDYSQYQAAYAPAAQPYHPMGLSSARPGGYAMTPYQLDPGASSATSAYAQPLQYYRGDQASEQAPAIVNTRASYSPRQPTTSG